uniref:Uncharacterized protein n=1 Tax=Oxyrrhis marina TaxID=2969 RepID=A0A6U9K8Z2_OXYMA
MRARRLAPVDTAQSTESKAQFASAQSAGHPSSRAGIQASAPPSPAPMRKVDPMAAVMRSPEVFHILGNSKCHLRKSTSEAEAPSEQKISTSSASTDSHND